MSSTTSNVYPSWSTSLIYSSSLTFYTKCLCIYLVSCSLKTFHIFVYIVPTNTKDQVSIRVGEVEKLTVCSGLNIAVVTRPSAVLSTCVAFSLHKSCSRHPAMQSTLILFVHDPIYTSLSSLREKRRVSHGAPGDLVVG